MAWYHTFFEGLPQQTWKLGRDEMQTGLEADFLEDVLQLGDGAHVFDVFSGYGRHALPLAARGARLWCVDISREATEELALVSREEHLGIQVLCADFMEAVLPPVTMDAAYCMGNSFSFFNRVQMVEFLAKIGSALKPGGLFVAHTCLLAESILPLFQHRNWMEIGEGEEKVTYLAENNYDAREGVIRARLMYFRKGESASYEIEQYVYTLGELEALFNQAGFEVREVFADIDGEPFTLGDEQAYLLAAKI